MVELPYEVGLEAAAMAIHIEKDLIGGLAVHDQWVCDQLVPCLDSPAVGQRN